MCGIAAPSGGGAVVVAVVCFVAHGKHDSMVVAERVDWVMYDDVKVWWRCESLCVCTCAGVCGCVNVSVGVAGWASALFS